MNCNYTYAQDVQIEIQLQLLATDVSHTLDLMLAGEKETMI